MSQEFVAAEVDKIIKSKEFEYPQNMAMAAAWILGNLKGINLKVFDVSSSSSLADFYVLASASNSTQANSMADAISANLRRNGMKFISKEGVSGSDWILLDGGDIIVHIFQESARDVYELESVWTEAKQVKIPNDYYFSSEDAEAAENATDKKGRDFF
ncbi:MAG: ribosome silencing factor [Halobacteriovoraceae bacterium]|jgi:ribosome-associated protein|nr:ribosome silencing factor [Halobacteriovoraceae bacterium]MBC99049.1 ribosome silencing factor [Halobacteriovoraceae bacterium]|tara:strand:- start:103812 stop:104285 length:474 start_codon:yes stop_codon:yes gene_type:complete